MTTRIARPHTPIIDRPETWRDQALCAEVDRDWFFPEKGDNWGSAKRICALCPVKAECLEDALENNEEWGIWGGTTDHERREIKARRREAVA